MSLIVLAWQAQAINQICSDLLGRHSSCPRAGAKSHNFCDFQGRLAQVERSWEAASERMRKWRANEKMERKWRKNKKMERHVFSFSQLHVHWLILSPFSLYFLIFSPFSHSLSIFLHFFIFSPFFILLPFSLSLHFLIFFPLSPSLSISCDLNHLVIIVIIDTKVIMALMLKVVIEDRCVLKKWLALPRIVIGRYGYKSSFGANNVCYW